MGWWRIASVGNPGISYSKPKNGDLVIGDSVADIMAEAVLKIGREYKKVYNRNPKKRELRACLNFIMPDEFEE